MNISILFAGWASVDSHMMKWSFLRIVLYSAIGAVPIAVAAHFMSYSLVKTYLFAALMWPSIVGAVKGTNWLLKKAFGE